VPHRYRFWLRLLDLGVNVVIRALELDRGNSHWASVPLHLCVSTALTVFIASRDTHVGPHGTSRNMNTQQQICGKHG
jgi:hypothetical protein